MKAFITGGAGFTPPLLVEEPRTSYSLEERHPSMHYVYVLQSLTSSSWYIGCTSDLQNRLSLHEGGEVLATKGKGPWELLYYEVYRERTAAYGRERSLKQFGGAYRQLRRRLTSEETAR